MANTVEILESILQQDAHEAERRLGETIGRLYCELRDINAFSGSAPVLRTTTEYEKDIEHRRDTFLSRVKQTVSDMNFEQRRELSSAINDLARRWLGPHISRLQEELKNLATRLQFHDSQMLDLGIDRVFKAIDAQLHIIFIEKGGRPVAFNYINIVNSSVGVVALESTLSTIDANVGNIKNSGDVDIAHAISQVTEEVAQSDLTEGQKREILEQVELLTEQAQKPPNDRKPAIVKAAMSFMEKALSSAAKLVIVWKTCAPVIKSFFGYTDPLEE